MSKRAYDHPYSIPAFHAASTAHVCLHITGDNRKPESTICGRPRAEATVYCADHFAACVVKKTAMNPDSLKFYSNH